MISPPPLAPLNPDLDARVSPSEGRQSMRAFLADLANGGDLAVVDAPVDSGYELAACLKLGEAGPALLFRHVVDDGQRCAMPVVGNLLTSRERIAQALRCPVSRLGDVLVAAIEAPVDPVVISSGACQDVVVDAPDLLRELPTPRFFEGEGGPYITAGVIVARDTRTGHTNLSIARLMPLGGGRAFVGVAPNHHLAVLARAAQARGETLDIAVCIGNAPAVLLAACLYLDLGTDELRVAGALLGEPVEVVPTAAGLLVPAACECVLEGTLDAGAAYEEGAVSEFHGMYETYGAGFVANIARLTRRGDAIYQAILPGYAREHCLLGGVAIAGGLRRALQRAVPSVRDVAVGLGGAGRLHAVVSLDGPRAGAARKTMFAVWAAVNLIKQVTVVDADVNPWDPVEVEWAVATRMRADRDLLVVPDVQADRSEPLEQGGLISKLGIDATRRAGDRPGFELATPPAAAVQQARNLLQHARRVQALDSRGS